MPVEVKVIFTFVAPDEPSAESLVHYLERHALGETLDAEFNLRGDPPVVVSYIQIVK